MIDCTVQARLRCHRYPAAPVTQHRQSRHGDYPICPTMLLPGSGASTEVALALHPFCDWARLHVWSSPGKTMLRFQSTILHFNRRSSNSSSSRQATRTCSIATPCRIPPARRPSDGCSAGSSSRRSGVSGSWFGRNSARRIFHKRCIRGSIVISEVADTHIECNSQEGFLGFAGANVIVVEVLTCILVLYSFPNNGMHASLCLHILCSPKRFSYRGLTRLLQGQAQLGALYLGEVNTESIHIHAVKKTGKTLAESRQALMHQLQVHKVCLQTGHGICKFGKLRLESIYGWLRMASLGYTITKTMRFSQGRPRVGA